MSDTRVALELSELSLPERFEPAWLDRAAYPFAPRRLRLPDGEISYLDEGSGPTLLFAHGTPTWSFEWRHLVRALRGRFRCVAPDHLGFGLSERPLGADYRPEAHAERFAAFVAALDLRDVMLVVHDFGGPIALPLALAGDGRVRRLVVLNSWVWSFLDDPATRRTARLAGSFLARVLYRYANASLRILTPGAYGDRRKLTRAIHGQYLAPFRSRVARDRVLFALARALAGSHGFFEGLWRRRAALAALPTLIVWGLRDNAFKPAALARWRAALPDATVVTLPDAGHWPHEEEPEAVLAAFEAFLARPPAPAALPL